MKTCSFRAERATVLITALMTITILTLLSAVSLYITSQNQITATQTASWHQSLSAAEAGIDKAVAALNSNSWSGWKVLPYSNPASGYTIPSAEPTATATPSASTMPASGYYNYFPSASLRQDMTGEGSTVNKTWVTVDTAGMSTSEDSHGKQWYRIRSVGRAVVDSRARASMNKLDADLRNTIAMNFSRKGSSDLGPTRTIEAIMKPIFIGTGYGGVTVGSQITMSGGGFIDSFTSSLVPSPHQWALAYRSDHAEVGIVANTSNSDLKSTFVYGDVSYSGPVIKNTGNVQHQPLTTPGPAAPSAAPTPNASLTWTAYSYPGGSANYQLGNNGGSSTYLKINGDLTISGGNSLHLLEKNSGNSTQNTIYIWVTGKLTTSGSGYMAQDGNVNVVFYVGSDITVSGSSFQNQSGFASQLVFNGYGAGKKADISGSGAFTGVLYAPTYDVKISGGGGLTGSVTCNTLDISGGASIHCDEDLNGGGNPTLGNFSFASWFEDNSDPSRKSRAADNNLYPIVY